MFEFSSSNKVRAGMIKFTILRVLYYRFRVIRDPNWFFAEFFCGVC